jgi:hypothetical protein
MLMVDYGKIFKASIANNLHRQEDPSYPSLAPISKDFISHEEKPPLPLMETPCLTHALIFFLKVY